VLVYAAADFALNRFGFAGGWTILWPLNGITIAILLMRPRAEWPWILLGVGVGTGFSECFDNNTLASELWLRLFSVTEIYLTARLLPPFTSLNQWLTRPRLFRTFAIALMVGPGVSGLFAAAFFHETQGQSYLLAFNNWATADALGIAAFIPLAFSFNSVEMRDLFRLGSFLKTVVILTAALAVMTLSLLVTQFSMLFLIFPTLLAVDLLLAFAGSAIASAGLSLIAIYLTVNSQGVFGLWHSDLPLSRGVALQIFLAFQVLALFPVSIRIWSRRILVEDLNRSNAQLLTLASLDGLTGLFNRRSLDAQLDQEWRRAIRLKTPIALVMIDVDHFKQFNDLYGHPEGDETLRVVARTLLTSVRRAQDGVARYGGEEFALLLPHTDLVGAQKVAETIRASVLSLKIPHPQSPWKYVTVSVGCSALTPTLGIDQADLLHLADAALYKAKSDGRNCTYSATASKLQGPKP